MGAQMIADELRALAENAYDLDGVLVDVAHGSFDDVCKHTIERVREALYAARALADCVEAVERDAEKWKMFAFEMCQVHVCVCGSGKTERDAMLGAESAEMAIEAGLVENGLPPIGELRAWYVAIKEQADAT